MTVRAPIVPLFFSAIILVGVSQAHGQGPAEGNGRTSSAQEPAVINIQAETAVPEVDSDSEEIRLQAALNALEEASQQAPEVRFLRGLPVFVSVRVDLGVAAPDDPVEKALVFLERFSDLYQLQQPRNQLYLE